MLPREQGQQANIVPPKPAPSSNKPAPAQPTYQEIQQKTNPSAPFHEIYTNMPPTTGNLSKPQAATLVSKQGTQTFLEYQYAQQQISQQQKQVLTHPGMYVVNGKTASSQDVILKLQTQKNINAANYKNYEKGTKQTLAMISTYPNDTRFMFGGKQPPPETKVKPGDKGPLGQYGYWNTHEPNIPYERTGEDPVGRWLDRSLPSVNIPGYREVRPSEMANAAFLSFGIPLASYAVGKASRGLSEFSLRQAEKQVVKQASKLNMTVGGSPEYGVFRPGIPSEKMMFVSQIEKKPVPTMNEYPEGVITRYQEVTRYGPSAGKPFVFLSTPKEEYLAKEIKIGAGQVKGLTPVGDTVKPMIDYEILTGAKINRNIGSFTDVYKIFSYDERISPRYKATPMPPEHPTPFEVIEEKGKQPSAPLKLASNEYKGMVNEGGRGLVLEMQENVKPRELSYLESLEEGYQPPSRLTPDVIQKRSPYPQVYKPTTGYLRGQEGLVGVDWFTSTRNQAINVESPLVSSGEKGLGFEGMIAPRQMNIQRNIFTMPTNKQDVNNLQNRIINFKQGNMPMQRQKADIEQTGITRPVVNPLRPNPGRPWTPFLPPSVEFGPSSGGGGKERKSYGRRGRVIELNIPTLKDLFGG